MSLSIRLFGPIQVFVEGHPVQHPRSRKAFWLLALLTLRQRAPVEREWLASMLWPDSDRAQALANLRTTLSELRSALGPEGERLQTPARHTVQIELAQADVDVIEFDRCVTSGKRSDLEQAVALYRGQLLEGSNEEWVGQERGAREQDCLRALQVLGETSLSAGDAEAAIAWFRQAVALDPWWDASHRGLMEAYAKAGDLNEALLVYRAFEERLRSESAGRPDEKTSALYSQLRGKARGQRATAPASVAEPPRVSGYIPQPITEIVGREDERRELLVLLRRSRLITLTGLGGIGKTRLAIGVANAVEEEFPDGRWFVSLSSIMDGAMVPRQVCAVLNLTDRPGKTWLDVATDHLRTKRAMLILDNCEHLTRACAAISRHLLQECAGVRILTTSREPLGILGESVWLVPNLPVPDPNHLPQVPATLQRVIASYDGVQLFLERAKAANRNFDLNNSNALAIAEICFGLDGVPLAIELAASRVKSLGVSQIRARLADHLDLLARTGRPGEERHQALRSTLDWSYQLLSEVERTLLRKLSVFVGGWTLQAAEELCSEQGDVAGQLASLVDRSLVLFADGANDGGERYRMLETVRQYATEKLKEHGESEAIEKRHREWCLAHVDRANAAILSKSDAASLGLVGDEYGNLLKALTGFENDPAGGIEGLRMVSALTQYWNIRGPISEGRDRLQRALSHPGAVSETPERAKALSSAGSLAYHGGDAEAARASFEESLPMFGRFGDLVAIMFTSNNLGNALHYLCEFELAINAYERCIALAKEANRLDAYALGLNNLAYLLLNSLGEARQAREKYGEALNANRECGVLRGISIGLEGLGFAATHLGEYEAARVYHEEALAIRQEMKARQASWSIYHLGVVAYSRADFPTALGHFDRSITEFREADNQSGVAGVTKFLSLIEFSSGHFDEAELLGEEALSYYRGARDSKRSISALSRQGNIAVDRGMLEEGRSLMIEALTLGRTIGARRATIMCLDSFAGLLTAEGNHSGAVRLWAATHSWRERTGVKRPIPVEARIDRDRDRALENLGEEEFEHSWAEGLTFSLEEAVTLALSSA